MAFIETEGPTGQPDQGPERQRVERLLRATAHEDPALRAAVVKAVASADRATDAIWQWVVLGLMLLAGIALLGVLYLLAQGNPNTPPELALTAFVGLLGGLLGLLIGA